MNNSISRSLETGVLSLLEANQGKKCRCHELSKRFEVTKDMMARTMERLAGKHLVTVEHPHGGKHYSHKEAGPAEEPETRTFIQKPYVWPAGMVNRLNEARENKIALPSKTNTDDAGELSEMDRNKLRMMGSGN